MSGSLVESCSRTCLCVASDEAAAVLLDSPFILIVETVILFTRCEILRLKLSQLQSTGNLVWKKYGDRCGHLRNGGADASATPRYPPPPPFLSSTGIFALSIRMQKGPISVIRELYIMYGIISRTMLSLIALLTLFGFQQSPSAGVPILQTMPRSSLSPPQERILIAVLPRAKGT